MSGVPEGLVIPLAEWKTAGELAKAPATTHFIDPVRLANTNLATDKPVETSAPGQGPHVPRNAVDAIPDNSSGWHCGESPAWLRADLQQVYPIDRIKVFPYYDGGRYYQYTVEVSEDGKVWRGIADMSANTI